VRDQPVRPAQEEKEEKQRRTPLLDRTVSQVRSLMLQLQCSPHTFEVESESAGMKPVHL
jgi:hypothetical protein